MNYLAHIFLSGNNQSLQIGNFIADFVKGNQLYSYPADIQEGISLHRKIDTFTDNHPIVLELCTMLSPSFGRYSPILLDMYFDYFLANSFRSYSPNKNLWIFSWQFYGNLIQHYSILPTPIKKFMYHFMITNRLYQYKSIKGLHSSLQIMSTYKIKAINADKSIHVLIENKDILHRQFQLFFTELLQYTSEERSKTH